MNRFQWKLEGLSRKKPLMKLCLNCPLHLKYVLALPWEILSVRLSHQRNNEWLTEWQQTITWLAVIVSQKKSHVSHHIIFITASAQNVPLLHERKHVDAAPLAYSTFDNRVIQSGPLAVDASFQFVDVRDLSTIDLLLISGEEVTDCQWFSGLTMIFWAGMRYPALFIVVNVQNTTSAFHKVVWQQY